jgi:L-2,4-diaminobutyrate decarboxylase
MPLALLSEANQSEIRSRIAPAYDPALLKSAGSRLIEHVAHHLESVQNREGSVLNWRPPVENLEAAAATLHGHAADPQSVPDRIEELARLVLARGQNLHHPRYVGHQVPASIPLAGLFDALGAMTNQVMAVYEMGPFVTAVEKVLAEKLGAKIGWTAGTFAGFATHGGSLANLTALLTARNVALPRAWEQGLATAGSPVLVTGADSHYSIARAAGVLGLGTEQVVKAELDSRRRIDPVRLDDLLRQLRDDGWSVIAVAASGCATPIGAFDPLPEIADVCQRWNVWLHVDAAHGGAALFSDRHRSLLDGIDRADSVVWDAHKMLFVPALCAFVFYRNAEHRYEAFRQSAPYLFDPAAPGGADFDLGLQTLECTKRAAALGLWGVWSTFGPGLFADLVDLTFDLTRRLHGLLTEQPDFAPLHEPQCNILAFRYLPTELAGASPAAVGDFQLALRRHVIESGDFYLVPVKLDGIGALRVTLINPLTKVQDLRDLLDTLRRHGRAVLASGGIQE